MLMTPSTRKPNFDSPTSDRAEPAKIWKARCYIREHSEEELSLTAVARFVKISPNHLSEKFKEVTGVKFVDYIARLRFTKACLLLQNPHLRISEIAFEVGFQSLSQFNRVFKKFSGQSPTKFRAKKSKLESSAFNGSNGCKTAYTLAEKMRSRTAVISGTLRDREAISGHALAPRRK
jgi:AraC-like DNA-binding protein